MSTISGWCSTHGKPQCRWCRSDLCSHHCHDGSPVKNAGVRTSGRVESGAQSGPESAATDRGLPITQVKDVTG